MGKSSTNKNSCVQFLCYRPLFGGEDFGARHFRDIFGFWGDLFTQPKAGYKYHPESESQVIPSKIFNSDVVKKWRGLRLSLRTSTFGKSISIVLHMRLVCSFVHFFSESLEEFNESQNFWKSRSKRERIEDSFCGNSLLFDWPRNLGSLRIPRNTYPPILLPPCPGLAWCALHVGMSWSEKNPRLEQPSKPFPDITLNPGWFIGNPDNGWV